MVELPVQRCPRCGALLPDIKGSRLAVCQRCGYKDDCCRAGGASRADSQY